MIMPFRLADAEEGKVRPMRRGRAICGVALLFFLAAIVAPLLLAFIGLDASGIMDQLERIRMRHFGQVLLCFYLGLSVEAGWLMYSARPVSKSVYATVLRLAGSCLAATVCPLVWGRLLMDFWRWPDWTTIAWRLIR